MDGPPPLSIGDILALYQSEVVPSLAAALTIDDEFPEEVLNEIRNALTHIAGAHEAGDNEKRVQHELQAARRHIRRVCLDCLKVSILSLAKKCETAIDALTYDLQLPNDVYQTMASLRNARQALSAREGTRNSDDPTNDYKNLLNDFDKFYRTLDNNYAGQTAEMRRTARLGKEKKVKRSAFFWGVFGGVISSIIFALLSYLAYQVWLFFFSTAAI